MSGLDWLLYGGNVESSAWEFMTDPRPNLLDFRRRAMVHTGFSLSEFGTGSFVEALLRREGYIDRGIR